MLKHGFGPTNNPMYVWETDIELKLLNTSSCVVSFIPLKDQNGLTSLRKLPYFLKNYMQEIKCWLCYIGKKQTTLVLSIKILSVF